jgi:hypothetical protein
MGIVGERFRSILIDLSLLISNASLVNAIVILVSTLK